MLLLHIFIINISSNRRIYTYTDITLIILVIDLTDDYLSNNYLNNNYLYVTINYCPTLNTTRSGTFKPKYFVSKIRRLLLRWSQGMLSQSERGNAQKSSPLTIPAERSTIKHAKGTFVFLLISTRREITRVGRP